MRKRLIIIFALIISIITVLSLYLTSSPTAGIVQIVTPEKSHWLILHRKSGNEFLYYGKAGDTNNSRLIRTFQVKPGIEASSPTPLPKLLGRDYWLITKKESSMDNPETAPYFLTLDIPTTGDFPYGPVPYEECVDVYTGKNIQCDWILPGYFGLHGVNGNNSKLSKEDLGSSGCVRHTDSDITYLFNLLDPDKEEIRYYVEDI